MQLRSPIQKAISRIRASCFGFGGIFKIQNGGAEDKIYPGVTEKIRFTFECDTLRNFLRLGNEKVSGVQKVLVEW